MGITELTIAVWPWLLTMLVFLVIVTYWPGLSLWLPRCSACCERTASVLTWAGRVGPCPCPTPPAGIPRRAGSVHVL